MSGRYISEIRFERERFESASLSPSDGYLRSLAVLKRLDVLELGDVTFLCGENGMGKSTLIEAVAKSCGFNPEGGSRNMRFATYRSDSVLSEFTVAVRSVSKPRDGYFLRAESFYNVASEIERLDAIPAAAPKLIDGYGGVSLHEMSHGESFFALMLNRFGGKGLYILDEPEAALSPTRVMSMLTLIHDLVADGSQFIISTHSPILLAYPDAVIYELREDGIHPTAYRDTATYRIMRQFLDSPERMARYLTE